MLRSVAFAATLISLLSLPEFASAQFRGRGEDSGRDRGSDSSDRDRWRGFDRGSDRGGEDRSRWGGWGGFSRSEGGDGRPSWGGWSGRGDGESRGFGPPGGFGGGFGPPGGFGGGFGPPGGFSGFSGGFRPSPDFLFDRLDRNQDGRLDDDELKNAWGPMQGMIERAGIRPGATKDDFAQGFEKAREEYRSERDGSDGGRDGRSRQSSKYYTPAKKERVTVDLPESYRTRDEDGDGQIGFYEWRAYRGDLDEFLAYDRNGDGFLTPKEIAAGPMEQPAGQTDAATQVASGPPAADDPEAANGRKYFELVDADHDGRATPAELARLKKLRPVFEKAGANLDAEMTRDQFVASYLKGLRQ